LREFCEPIVSGTRWFLAKVRALFEILADLRHVSDIFDDWVTRLAGIILFLLIGNVAFNIVFSHLLEENPFLELISLAMVLILIVVGGIVFFIAIAKYYD
jgi:Na+/H+-dicarboxylate symporter